MFLCIISGFVQRALIISSIIIIHELGHYTIGAYYKWEPKRITLYPFGGITFFKAKINHSLSEEFQILIGGFVFQFIYILLALTLNKLGILSDKTILLFYNYSTLIFLLNLLPIYPLDGIKYISIILKTMLPFKLSHKITIVLSIISLIILLIIYNNLFFSFNILMIATVLIINIIKQINNHKHKFNKFLLERYLYKPKYKNNRVIKNIQQMYMKKNNYLVKDNKILDEESFLTSLFKSKKVDL